VALVVGLVVLHFLLRVGLGLGMLAPDLLLVAFLLAARRARPGWAAGLGFGLGLLEGAVSYNVGISSLVLSVLGYVAARSREWLASEGPVYLFVFLFLGKLAYDLALLGVAAAVADPNPTWAQLLVTAVQAVYTGGVGVAVVAAYRNVT
jgi:rod shape-determining protein MreD